MISVLYLLIIIVIFIYETKTSSTLRCLKLISHHIHILMEVVVICWCLRFFIMVRILSGLMCLLTINLMFSLRIIGLLLSVIILLWKFFIKIFSIIRLLLVLLILILELICSIFVCIWTRICIHIWHCKWLLCLTIINFPRLILLLIRELHRTLWLLIILEIIRIVSLVIHSFSLLLLI